MFGLFYVAAAIAIAATALALSRSNVLHGLLYLVVSLLAVALAFFALGAPFVAALEGIVYAGAIIVLFVFVVMMLGLAPQEAGKTSRPIALGLGAFLLAGVLAAELIGLLGRPAPALPKVESVENSQRVALALYGPYLVGVELASMLLLGALVGAHHLGRRRRPGDEPALPTKGNEHGNSGAARSDFGDVALRPGPLRAAPTAQPGLRPHVP